MAQSSRFQPPIAQTGSSMQPTFLSKLVPLPIRVETQQDVRSKSPPAAKVASRDGSWQDAAPPTLRKPLYTRRRLGKTGRAQAAPPAASAGRGVGMRL